MTNTQPPSKTLLCFGFGYVAAELGRIASGAGWRVIGTTRDRSRFQTMEKSHVEPVVFAPGHALDPRIIGAATHVLVSVPPGQQDPVFDAHGEDLVKNKNIKWFGYLSTTGVYGDHGGGWVDEDTEPKPTQDRSRDRLKAELEWLSLAARGLPAQIFRLPGIYGPGRSVISELKSGRARRIIKPGQFFSRIHVADIAACLFASMQSPAPGRIYNLADDEPAPSSDVLAFAAGLLGMAPPIAVPFEEADLSPMARSFYSDNRRVSNGRMKRELRPELLYPSYREGLRAEVES